MTKKLESAFVLGALLISSVWAGGNDSDDLSGEEGRKSVFSTRIRASEIGSQKERWWNEYKNSGQKIVPYVESISKINPEAAAWFLITGGKYGFANRRATEEEKSLMTNAMQNVAIDFVKQKTSYQDIVLSLGKMRGSSLKISKENNEQTSYQIERIASAFYKIECRVDVLKNMFKKEDRLIHKVLKAEELYYNKLSDLLENEYLKSIATLRKQHKDLSISSDELDVKIKEVANDFFVKNEKRRAEHKEIKDPWVEQYFYIVEQRRDHAKYLKEVFGLSFDDLKPVYDKKTKKRIKDIFREYWMFDKKVLDLF